MALNQQRQTLTVSSASAEAFAHHQRGETPLAAKIFRQILAFAPAEFTPLYLLGVIHLQRGRADDGIVFVRRALGTDPLNSEAHFNLAVHAQLNRQESAAITSARRALILEPGHWQSHHILANALVTYGQSLAAALRYQRVLAITPQMVEALANQAVELSKLAFHPRALSCIRRVLALEPANNIQLKNYFLILSHLGQGAEAQPMLPRLAHLAGETQAAEPLARVELRSAKDAATFLRRALALSPGLTESWSRMAQIQIVTSDHDAAIISMHRSLAITPDAPGVHTNLIFALDFSPTADVSVHQRERRRWARHHAERFYPRAPFWRTDFSAQRRLRIGYVSADFGRHSAAFIFGAAVRYHDKSRFTTALYSNLDPTLEDDETQAFKETADVWRSVHSLSDSELAAQIVHDRIDILVDLSGHTSGHRLLAFARKPAPVQVTAWGHVTGTGLSTMDYLFVDPIVVPSHERSLFVESLVDLPCMVAYAAPTYAPDVSPPPSDRGRPVTFGSFNRLAKVTPETISLWSRLLAQLPETRLMLKDKRLDSEDDRLRVAQAFSGHEIDPNRIVLQGTTSHPMHLSAYGEIDIALDPFPQSGGTTTLEALWMGVPVVTRLGRTLPSRASGAILSSLHRTEWIADSNDMYIRIASNLAGSPDLRRRWRRDLRPLMAASEVGNPARYCRAVEAAYLKMWERCIDQRSQTGDPS